VERVRSQFVEYFEKKHAHVNYKSSPVVPVNDPTLLFANAGMNQFKPIFIGTVDPSSPLAGLTRAVNSQKCIRAGGKHNDLDDVGKDTYHHTFFEMLGTWSFGNYFKKEAIDWAYDILVNTYKLPVERLYASYFAGDEAQGLPCDTEARDFWLQYLPPERVLPFDKKANFWEMGETGPCGPCSEIHFDRIGGRDAAKLVNADDPDVIEIWNLVFIQFNREPSGELRSLPDKHIDTGMGLERLTSILQDKRSNYDTDVFDPIFKEIQKIVGCPPYTGKLGAEDAAQNYRDMAYRVVADHIRTLSFAIADGAVPSNEGRGYVLRRILRRAVRYGMQTLGAKPGFFSKLVPVLAQGELGVAFPELRTKTDVVAAVIADEEQSFSSLLDRGVKYFADIVAEVKAEGIETISGERAFYLYDTLGFPVDLTQLMAAEKGLNVDLPGFQNAMNQQKERGRTATRAKRLAGRTSLAFGAEQTAYLSNKGISPTDDSSKYNSAEHTLSTNIEAIFLEKGFVDVLSDQDVTTDKADDLSIGVVLKATPFYAESGGQVPDSGTLSISMTNEAGQSVTLTLDVLDVQVYAGFVLHTCVLSEDSASKNLVGLATNSPVNALVDYARRKKVAPNHTMTHVLNYALRKVVGDDVDQKGSLVSEEKFRFDFSCNRAVQATELQAVEKIMNDVIRSELEVSSAVVPLKEALSINGLRAVFGEAYPDPVRVISVGPSVGSLLASPSAGEWREHSIEFCGGTHMQNTREAGACCIVEETAVAKGIRRISGITGAEAVSAKKYEETLKSLVSQLSKQVKAGGDATKMDSDVVAFRGQLEEAVISQGAKSLMRIEVENLQRDLASEKNKQLMSRVDESIKGVKSEAEAIAKSGTKTAIFNMNIGSDAKAIKRAIDEISKVSKDLSFLCISADEEKITVFAKVTDEAQKTGLKANEWVSTALVACGGRGGGKPGMAQGSGSDLSKLGDVQAEAKKLISKF